jgi:signal recognition particle receptor subunit alpha
MLDTFEILTTSGIVLWSKTYAPVGAGLVNSLLRDVFIEERPNQSAHPTYTKDNYTLKWTTAKDLGLIFVVRARCAPFVSSARVLTGE